MRLSGLTRQSLATWLAGFLVVLIVPTTVLVYQASRQLKWEAFYQHQQLARQLAASIDGQLIRWVNIEQARAYGDYAFLGVDPGLQFVQRSPLSGFPVDATIPGLVGYFQVDANGVFSSPLVPEDSDPIRDLGVSDAEMAERVALRDTLLRVLAANRLIGSTREADLAASSPARQREDQSLDDERQSAPEPMMVMDEELAELDAAEGQPAPIEKKAAERGLASESPVAQAAFDRLNQAPTRAQADQAENKLGRVEDLKLESTYADQAKTLPQSLAAASNAELLKQRSGARKETSAQPEQYRAPAAGTLASSLPGDLKVRTFESELDPFEISRLDSGHFVLFRKVWRDGQRTIQGALIEPRAFLQGVFETPFAESALHSVSDLVVAYGGEVFTVLGGRSGKEYLSSADALRGELLYQGRMSAPLSDLEMIVSVHQLPIGPGGRIIGWMAAVMLVVLLGGFLGLYRLGLKQIELITQQQDFVSSVSHELKTPLTSIRMYGEMLREGWASEDKKQTYYDYIFDESERLSRLIENVLQLARMTRNDLSLELAPVTVGELLEELRSKIGSTVERAGFEMVIIEDTVSAAAQVWVDRDALTQIVINLVDNALKFAANNTPQRIDLGAQLNDGRVWFTLRDHGPGVQRSQMKKIFRLFYRSENELTRETVGTGIGLALVHQLTLAMGGRVDVINRQPGAEFRVMLPLDSPFTPAADSD